MKKASFDTIARTLNEAAIPFLIVGGIAVVHHGYGRVTQDLDLVIRLEKDVILRAFHALESIGYRPTVPITADQFADPVQRDQWHREKGMQVITFSSEQHPETPLDIFVTEPFDFQHELDSANVRESAPGLQVRIVSLATLITMKKASGRPHDLADIDELNLLHEDPSSYDQEKT